MRTMRTRRRNMKKMSTKKRRRVRLDFLLFPNSPPHIPLPFMKREETGIKKDLLPAVFPLLKEEE